MSTEIEFPVGLYTLPDGRRITVLAAHDDARWVEWWDGTLETRPVLAMRSWQCKPYVAPVITERWCNVYAGNSWSYPSRAQADYNSKDSNRLGVVKLTFEDGRLVKAEVEK